jgi:hypothetical protein
VKRRAFLVLPVLALALASCVSKTIAPKATSLVVTRVGRDVTIQWMSETDKVYSVIYSDRLSRGARFQLLPSATRIRGTGQLIRLRDTPPEGVSRLYDLHIEPAQ